jgi:3-hydroxypropanoate dehydrogenase
MRTAVTADALDQIFRSARTYQGWTDTPGGGRRGPRPLRTLEVGPDLGQLQPGAVCLGSQRGGQGEARCARVRKEPTQDLGGACDRHHRQLEFADALPKLMPHNTEATQKTLAAPGMPESTAMRNGSLQGAYLIIAARALGLDCGPMSGFDNAGVDKAFFAGTRIQSNFICSIGHGDPASVFPRNPRLSFEEAGHFE